MKNIKQGDSKIYHEKAIRDCCLKNETRGTWSYELKETLLGTDPSKMRLKQSISSGKDVQLSNR